MSPKNKKITVPSQTTSSASKRKSTSVAKDFKDAYNLAMKSYWDRIQKDNRLKLIDIFCLFLVLIAVVQFIFMLLIRDTFPFNAFLSGFIICVGQFVLLISLRLQLLDDFPGIPKNRAFGEFILASLILHFISLHFIN